MPADSTEESQEYITLCSECQSGAMHLEHITYFTWLNEELITVPNFPAWICDLCGRREYDARAVAWLNMLLSPDTGSHSTPRRWRAPGAFPPHA
jgi:YgiT-type zinc finger domain-containing protein